MRDCFSGVHLFAIWVHDLPTLTNSLCVLDRHIPLYLLFIYDDSRLFWNGNVIVINLHKKPILSSSYLLQAEYEEDGLKTHTDGPLLETLTGSAQNFFHFDWTEAQPNVNLS